MPHNAMMNRIRAEYLEMPGLRLTFAQVQRLCGVEPGVCEKVLDALVSENFLCIKADGAYARLTEGEVYRRTLKVDLDLRDRVRSAS
jgi:hypothetical protein